MVAVVDGNKNRQKRVLRVERSNLERAPTTVHTETVASDRPRGTTILMAIKDVGRSTPVAEVIRRLLENANQPLRLEELAVNALNLWGRDFPNNPYEDLALIYKIATTVVRCTVSYEDVGGKVPLVERSDIPVKARPLTHRLGPKDLNCSLEQLRALRLALPKA